MIFTLDLIDRFNSVIISIYLRASIITYTHRISPFFSSYIFNDLKIVLRNMKYINSHPFQRGF